MGSSADIETWEGEGGSALEVQSVVGPPMSGTASQVEWAERIRVLVNAEFNRVSAVFLSIAAKQVGENRADTEATIAILEDKRVEVMSRTEAGYFIHDWQEIRDQVRLMIFDDPRYKAIKGKREARRR